MSASKSTLLGGVGAAVLVALLLGIAWRSQHELARNLPKPIACENALEALVRATQYVNESHGMAVLTSGTASMEPWIHGRAWVALRSATLDEVSDGSAVAYLALPGTVDAEGAPLPPGKILLHILATRDALGGIPTGLNNRHYENWGRITDENLVGVVERVWIWKQ